MRKAGDPLGALVHKMCLDAGAQHARSMSLVDVVPRARAQISLRGRWRTSPTTLEMCARVCACVRACERD